MKLLLRCHHCRQDTKVKSSAHNRYELADKKGDLFDIQCAHCQKESRYNVNEVSATKSNYIGVLALSIFVLGTLGILYFLKDYVGLIYGPKSAFVLAYVATIPSVIYVILNRQERGKVNNFNRNKVVVESENYWENIRRY